MNFFRLRVRYNGDPFILYANKEESVAQFRTRVLSAIKSNPKYKRADLEPSTFVLANSDKEAYPEEGTVGTLFRDGIDVFAWSSATRGTVTDTYETYSCTVKPCEAKDEIKEIKEFGEENVSYKKGSDDICAILELEDLLEQISIESEQRIRTAAENEQLEVLVQKLQDDNAALQSKLKQSIVESSSQLESMRAELNRKNTELIQVEEELLKLKEELKTKESTISHLEQKLEQTIKSKTMERVAKLELAKQVESLQLQLKQFENQQPKPMNQRKLNRLSKRSFTLESIVHEIIDTEQAYVENLNILIEVFVDPLHPVTGMRIITEAEYNSLFSNIKDIYNLHKIFLKDLLDMNDPKNQIAALILKFAPYFKLYSMYCSNQESQQQTYDSLQKNKSFAAFLQQAKLTPRCRKLPLDSFLMLPVQRICRYPLLLNEMLKNTPESAPFLKTLIAAKDEISKLVSFVNDRKKLAENLNKIMNLSLAIEGTPDNFQLLQPARRFVLEGTVGKFSKGKIHDRHFFLFNDVLIYTRPPFLFQSTWQFRGMIEQGAGWLEDMTDDIKGEMYRFKIIRKEDSSAVYIICTKTPEDKVKWMDALAATVLRRRQPVNSGEQKSWKDVRKRASAP